MNAVRLLILENELWNCKTYRITTHQDTVYTISGTKDPIPRVILVEMNSCLYYCSWNASFCAQVWEFLLTCANMVGRSWYPRSHKQHQKRAITNSQQRGGGEGKFPNRQRPNYNESNVHYSVLTPSMHLTRGQHKLTTWACDKVLSLYYLSTL